MMLALVIVVTQIIYTRVHLNNGQTTAKNKLWIIAAVLYAGGLGYTLWLISSVISELL